MLTPKDRMKVLSGIWTVYALFGVQIILFGEGMGAVIVLLGLAIFTLLAILGVVWSRVVDDTTDNFVTGTKATHSDMALVDRLIESMSDEEISALRKRLRENDAVTGDDGELVSLGELQACNHGYRQLPRQRSSTLLVARSKTSVERSP